jgi:hypothetical protein
MTEQQQQHSFPCVHVLAGSLMSKVSEIGHSRFRISSIDSQQGAWQEKWWCISTAAILL